MEPPPPADNSAPLSSNIKTNLEQKQNGGRTTANSSRCRNGTSNIAVATVTAASDQHQFPAEGVITEQPGFFKKNYYKKDCVLNLSFSRIIVREEDCPKERLSSSPGSR